MYRVPGTAAPETRGSRLEYVQRVLVSYSTFFFFFFFSAHFHFPASGQAVVTGVIPSPPRFLPSIFIAHRVQQSHCSSIVHRILLTHAPALSASQFVHKKKSQRIYTSMHSAGLELTKLTYTRLEDNLIRHRGDRLCVNRRVFFLPILIDAILLSLSLLFLFVLVDFVDLNTMATGLFIGVCFRFFLPQKSVFLGET